MKKAIIAGIGMLAVIAGGILVAARFDADGYVRGRQAQVLDDLLAGRRPVPSEADLAKRSRFHRGEGACFAYAPPPLARDERAEIVAELKQAALPDYGPLSILAAWSSEDEEHRHGGLSDEELRTGHLATARWKDHVLLWLRGDQILAAIRRLHREQEVAVERRGEEREAELSSAQRAALHAIWQRHRLALPVSALVQVAKDLRPKESPR